MKPQTFDEYATVIRLNLSRDDHGDFEDYVTHIRWITWQAAHENAAMVLLNELRHDRDADSVSCADAIREQGRK